MDKGFVYVARLIDYSGNFLGSFHKIGKSIQYKVRETQLNSTHLPVDILFVRVFETENQSMLEQILHTCFEDYRIQKQYVDRFLPNPPRLSFFFFLVHSSKQETEH